MPLLTGLLFLLAISAAATAADPTTYSVPELNASKEKWAELVELPLKVEGRVSAVSRHQFKFVHCDVFFRVTEDQSRTVGNVRNVEVSGRFKKDKDTGKIFFAVDRVKILGSDVEQFESMEAKLKSTSANDWYELAAWAETRGKFYDDEELATKARRVRLKGLHLERAALPASDADARLALAERFRAQQLDASLQSELIHEAARLNWQQAQKDGTLKNFTDWIKKTYPKSTEPLEQFPSDLNRKYESNPLETFRAANEADRDVLTRLLLIQAEAARIVPLAKPDGSNAVAVADELQARIPERTDLIDKYREQAFLWRVRSVGSASRQESLRLAEELRTLDRGDEARELLRAWIHAQESRLRKDGPIGLMQLADDYLQLIDDEATAVKRLAEAHQLDPSLEDAGDRLKQLGYHLANNRWIKGDASATPTMPGKAPSQLAVGMTADAVSALLGAPTAKSRILTGAGVQEVWSFGPRGTPRLLIHLQQSGAARLKVTRYLTEN